MKKITIWEKFNEKKQIWEHNHIEDGHIIANKPTGTKEQNIAWMKGTWRYFHKHLDSNHVVR